MRISLMHPFVPEAAVQAVVDVMHSKFIAQGPRVETFEKIFGEYVGRPAVAVGSGTDALHLAYVLAGIGPGDEVIAPLFTCSATNIPLLWLGAKIRFVDVAPRSLNVDWYDVKSMITERTKAIVLVHYGGSRVHNYCGSLGIRPLVPVIEDAAQALGVKGIGGADYTCFSFQAVKHVTTGDGGMLLAPEHQIAEAKRRRWFGIDREAKYAGIWDKDIKEVGYKYQMNDIAAAMGIAGMNVLDDQIAYRQMLMSCYSAGLEKTPGITLFDSSSTDSPWLCTVLVEDRKGLQKKLAFHDIESDQVHYRNDRYKIFQEFKGEFPNMDAIEDRYLCLPLHMKLTVSDVDRVCTVINQGW